MIFKVPSNSYHSMKIINFICFKSNFISLCFKSFLKRKEIGFGSCVPLKVCCLQVLMK